MKGFKDKDNKFHPTDKSNSGSVSPKDAKSNGSSKGIDKSKVNDLKEKKMTKPEIHGFKDGKSEREILLGVDENNQAVRIEVDLDRDSFSMSGTEFDLDEIFTEESGDKRAREMLQDQLDESPADYFPDWLLQNNITITDTDRRMIASEEGDRAVEDRELDELIQMADDNKVDYTEPEEPDEDDFQNKDGETDDDKYEEAMEKFEEKQEDLKDELNESVASAITDDVHDSLSDPIQYFVEEQGLYNKEELLEQAFIRIDDDAVIDEVISSDGWEHVIGDIEDVGNGKFVRWGSSGQIDMSNEFNMKDSPLSASDITTLKKAWKELHLKQLDSLTSEQIGLVNKVVDIVERHPEFETDQIGKYVKGDDE